MAFAGVPVDAFGMEGIAELVSGSDAIRNAAEIL
jgi:hypothetical protein